MEIIIDTNFCVIPFVFKVDIFEEIKRLIVEKYEIVILEPCIEELGRLKLGKPALALLNAKKIRIVPMEKTDKIDRLILKYAEEHKAFIATQDKEIKKKAREMGLKTITLRHKSHLIIS